MSRRGSCALAWHRDTASDLAWGGHQRRIGGAGATSPVPARKQGLSTELGGFSCHAGCLFPCTRLGPSAEQPGSCGLAPSRPRSSATYTRAVKPSKFMVTAASYAGARCWTTLALCSQRAPPRLLGPDHHSGPAFPAPAASAAAAEAAAAAAAAAAAPQSRTSAPTLPLGTGFTLASAYSAPLMTTGARLLQRAASASASRPASDAQPPP